MGKVLSIVYRTLSTHLIKKAGFTKAATKTGAVTLIQRFGSTLNPNIHFHMLFLDGVYAGNTHGKMHFHRVTAPTVEELNSLAHFLSHRVAGFLERKGLLEHDAESSYLALEPNDEDAMLQLQGHLT